jgi:DNA-directed RNA polymerase subunit RPC12/RpoP
MKQAIQNATKCPECGVKLSMFNKEGNYNFCPKSTADRKIIYVCMNCKIEEVIKIWKK